MSTWNGFQDLDLSNVEVTGDFVRLPVGKHIVKCHDAKVEQITGTANRRVVVEFSNDDGGIRTNFNIYHSNEQAQSIGKERFKKFLMKAGHPNPDKPQDVTTINGRTVGIIVRMGNPYINNDGEEVCLPEVKAFFDPNEKSESAEQTAMDAQAPLGSKPAQFDDEIPF